MFAHNHDHDFHCSGTWRKFPRFPARFTLDERMCLWDYRVKLPIYSEMPRNAREELQVIVCLYLNLGHLVGVGWCFWLVGVGWLVGWLVLLVDWLVGVVG